MGEKNTNGAKKVKTEEKTEWRMSVGKPGKSWGGCQKMLLHS